MPATSSLPQQIIDIGWTVNQNAANGQVNAQNIKIVVEALSAAVEMIGVCLAQIYTNTTAIGANLSATLGTTLTPGGTGWTTSSTQVPSNFVGTAADPVTLASFLSGASAIAVQQP